MKPYAFSLDLRYFSQFLWFLLFFEKFKTCHRDIIYYSCSIKESTSKLRLGAFEADTMVYHVSRTIS